MEGENPLDADSVRYLAHRKGRAVAAAIDLDHDPFELLEPLLLAFNDLDLNSQRIAGAKRGQILAQSTILKFWMTLFMGNNPQRRANQNSGTGRMKQPLLFRVYMFSDYVRV